VLVVRAWVEGDPQGGLRARITQTRDLAAGQIETVAVTVDEVLTTVRDWLEALLVDADAP
jgi:hypothetical protein